LHFGSQTQVVTNIRAAEVRSLRTGTQALLSSFGCEYYLAGVVNSQRFWMLLADLFLSEPASGQHPASRPLNTPKIDFLGDHGCYLLMLYELTVYCDYIQTQGAVGAESTMVLGVLGALFWRSTKVNAFNIQRSFANSALLDACQVRVFTLARKYSVCIFIQRQIASGLIFASNSVNGQTDEPVMIKNQNIANLGLIPTCNLVLHRRTSRDTKFDIHCTSHSAWRRSRRSSKN
jgi:hypothetical protein